MRPARQKHLFYSLLLLGFVVLTLPGCRISGWCPNPGFCEGDGGGGFDDFNSPSITGDCEEARIRGNWSTSSETLIFNSTCEFSSERCDVQGTYTLPKEVEDEDGDVFFDFNLYVTTELSPGNEAKIGCPPQGEYECSFFYTTKNSKNEIDLECENSVLVELLRGVYEYAPAD